MSFCSHFQHGLLPLPTPPLSDLNINVILVANALQLLQLQLSCRFFCGCCYCYSHRCCVGVYFKLLTVASIPFANNTAIITTVIALSGCRRCCLLPLPMWWKTHKPTVLHIFTSFCFGDDNSEFDSKCNGNNIGNGSGNALSLSVL